jgi:hypothetical protein
MPVIPSIQKEETVRSGVEASPEKVIMRPYLKNKLKAKGLGMCLK